MKYIIKLDDKVQNETDNEMVALANYRSLIRRADLPVDTHVATLECEDELLYETTVGGKSLSLKIGNNISANDLLKLLMKKHDISLADLKNLVRKSGLMVSNSKINGWLLDADKRKHQVMNIDEFFILFDALEIKTGYTPENYRKLIESTGLTNVEFIREFDINESTFYANISEEDKPRYVSMSYKSWQDIKERVKIYNEKALNTKTFD